MKIKICGIKSIEEARFAAACGADLLGFNFYPPSPRAISPAQCCQIVPVIRQEAPQVLLVGVFVNLGASDVHSILEQCDLDLAQLSGDESLEVQQSLGERAFKAVRLAKQAVATIGEGQIYRRKSPPALLLDADIPGQYGGTGKTVDWQVAASMAEQMPLLLAGGLTPENVAEAIRRVKPWGVDVASGVESSPGIKDFAKIKAFICNARTAFEALKKETA
ncbi:MAG: N-(5'-phosphoribosyl)anthranilate isomerase [Anaerolineae bacterium]|jgi:phosphoribosylanthranilate isomerase|nr:MAG: N-(5'-phosphoribosyl)anthranilate isomerase [Anaerolineae bacterium]